MRLLIILILLVSCSKEAKKTPPVPVEVTEAVARDVPVYRRAIGNVVGFLAVEVRPQVTGQILSAHVQEGEWVKEGDLLFTISRSRELNLLI